ncbi:ABC transporter permease [Actinomycetota bacterium]|nr:ABC transporter permease [Actinomycetota bacterium]
MTARLPVPRTRRRGARRRDEHALVAREDRYGFLDTIAEATADIGTRPARLVLTLAGTVLGIGALVATIGFSQTSAAHIASQFDAATTSQAVVRPVEVLTADGTSVPMADLPWDAAERVSRLAGVASAALLSDVPTDAVTVTAVEIQDPSASQVTPPRLVGASAGFLDAVQGSLVTGRTFDAGHDDRADRVAMLGARAAERFGLERLDTQPSLFIDGHPYAVIGIFDGLQYRAELLDAVVIPTGAARADLGVLAPTEVQVRLDAGAGPVVAAQAPRAVSPDAPDAIEVLASSGPSHLQRGVLSDVNVVLLIVSLIVLLAGGVGIASVTTLTVIERRSEIGLRRALGATSRQVAAQFMTESVVLGTVGGVIGAAVGVATMIAVALAQGWAPISDPVLGGIGVALGPLIGLLAGWVPARRAARVEPVQALRGD